jgi:hypothetical protein
VISFRVTSILNVSIGRPGFQRSSRLYPMPHHAGLRQREREKNADSIKRNQPARVACERDHQHGREHTENNDAV